VKLAAKPLVRQVFLVIALTAPSLAAGAANPTPDGGPPDGGPPATAPAPTVPPAPAQPADEAEARDPTAPTSDSTAPDPPPPPGDVLPAGDTVETGAGAEPPPEWLTLGSRGELGFESRAFWPDDTPVTYNQNAAMVGRLHVDAAASRVTGKVRVFSRFDPRDRARSVFIAEELWLELKLPHMRLRAGYQMINWTATEAFHPADVINSRYFDSAIENPEKLGEPMASLRVEIPHGSVDVMFMPVFIEPVFPTARTRQRFQPPGQVLAEPIVLDRGGDVVTQRSSFPAYRFVPQGALRVQQTWGSADVAVHALAHVDRSYPFVAFDPVAYLPVPVFMPVLQTGGTYQQALGALLVKLEAAYRWYQLPSSGQAPLGQPIPNRDHFVGAAGLEYSLPRAAGSESTLLLEGQLFVPQDRNLPYYAKPLFQHDVLVGVRHAFNDEASRALTIVGIVDVVRPQEFFINAGYAQRLGETWSLQAGVRVVRVPPRDPAAPQVFEWLNNSHHVYANLYRHF
jgi:hypothetical protein